MKSPRSFTRLIAAAFAVAVSIPTAGLASAVPVQAATLLSTSCETGTNHLIGSAQVQTAAAAKGSTVDFTCVDDLATVSVTNASGVNAALVAETKADRNIIDMTGMNAQQISEVGPVVEVGTVNPPTFETGPVLNGNVLNGDTASPDSLTINHAYRASSNDTITWGSKTTAGAVLWASSLRLATYISLQKSIHPFNLNYQSLGNRQIVLTVPVEMRQHKRAAGDTITDTNFWRAAAYGTGYAATKSLYSSNGAGKFFPRMSGMYLDDRAAGRRFQVGGTIAYPRFECYQSNVSCKYPNGAQAAW